MLKMSAKFKEGAQHHTKPVHLGSSFTFGMCCRCQLRGHEQKQTPKHDIRHAPGEGLYHAALDMAWVTYFSFRSVRASLTFSGTRAFLKISSSSFQNTCSSTKTSFSGRCSSMGSRCSAERWCSSASKG